jgi:inorganic pyrophosphatase
LKSYHTEFWHFLDALVARSQLALDRPKGTIHPRFPGNPYPLDYGYLAGTVSKDGGGVDVWAGSGDLRQVTGILCTIDLYKQDTELKILLGCTEDEMKTILDFVNQDTMRAICFSRQED